MHNLNYDEEDTECLDSLECKNLRKLLNSNLILNKHLLEALQALALFSKTFLSETQPPTYQIQGMTRNLEKIWDKCFTLTEREGLA